MYVCVCNAVSERAIREAVEGGVRTYGELQAETGCGTCCGCCEPVATQLMEHYLRTGDGPAAPMNPPRFRTLAVGSGG